MTISAQQAVSNYLGPAVGTMTAVSINQVFPTVASGTPFNYDPKNQSLDGREFRPSGVYIDNTQGTTALNVLVNQMSLNLSVPAGGFAQLPFPSPLGVTFSVTGDGTNPGTVVFVDYPVMPFRSW